MQLVELLVTLKIPDVTALTATTALRRRMGFAETLKKLARTEYYLLELDAADEAEALELARVLAERTNLFVNPNKHAFTVRGQRETLTPRQDEPGLWTVEVLITDAEGATATGIVSTLQGPLGYGQTVGDVRKGVLWTLQLAAADAAEAQALADDIVITRRRDKGLLMNPHFQAMHVL